MIIPSNALRATLSPTPETQGTKEEESGFGQLLTEIENHTSILAGQEDGERRALESVLQALLTLFQPLTTANPLPTGTTPGTGEAGLVGALPSLVLDGSQGTVQTSLSLGDGTGAAPTPGTVVAPESFALFLERQESTQNLSGLFTLRSTAPSPSGEHVALATDPLSWQVSASLSPETQDVQHAVLPGAGIALTDEGSGLSTVQPAAPSEPGGFADLTQSEGTSLASPDSAAPPTTGEPLQKLGVSNTRAFPDAEDPLVLSAVPQKASPGQEAAASDTLRTPLVSSETSGTDRASGPVSRPAAETQGGDPEATPSFSHLVDSGLTHPTTAGPAHRPSAESGATVSPPSSTPEDVLGTRQWPRPLPPNTVLLHLEPPELGTLLVQVRLSEKRLIASFRARSPEVEALLRTHLPTLHEALSQQGFEVQPITITPATEGFSARTGTGTGAFTQQHSTFHAFAQARLPSGAEETRNEVEASSIPPWPAERGHRLLDVLI